MKYTYEVDLSNLKTVRVTDEGKTGMLVISRGRQVGGESMGPYSPEEWLTSAKSKTSFTDTNGDTYASSAIVSVRLMP